MHTFQNTHLASFWGKPHEKNGFSTLKNPPSHLIPQGNPVVGVVSKGPAPVNSTGALTVLTVWRKGGRGPLKETPARPWAFPPRVSVCSATDTVPHRRQVPPNVTGKRHSSNQGAGRLGWPSRQHTKAHRFHSLPPSTLQQVPSTFSVGTPAQEASRVRTNMAHGSRMGLGAGASKPSSNEEHGCHAQTPSGFATKEAKR